MKITREHVAAIKRAMRTFPLDAFPPGDFDRLEELADELNYRLDMEEAVPEFPTEAEVEAMAKAAGLDSVPF